MATKREQIIVDIGGDASKLLKEFNVSKSAARQWAADTAKELTQGRLPEGWRAYTANVRAALNETKQATVASEKFGASLGKLAGRLIGLNVLKNVFSMAASAMRELSEEIARLDKTLDTKPYLAKERSQQIETMPEFTKESVVVGTVMFENLKKQFTDGLAKALAGADLGSKVWSNFIFGKDAAGYRLTLEAAAEKAVEEQKQIIDGIKIAAREKELAAEKDKQQQARDAHERKVIENFAKYEAQLRERNRIRAEQERTLLQEKLRLQKAITEEYLRQHQAAGVLGYKVARPQLGETIGELNDAGPDEGRTVYDGLNEYRRRTGNRMDLWMKHGREASLGVRSIRQPKDLNPNESKNSDVVAELQKITTTLPAGGLPVKVTLDK